MELITSNKGQRKLCFEGFMYTRHKEVATGFRWRCVKRATGCKGSVITVEGTDDIAMSSDHDHPPSSPSINVAKTRLRMKTTALISSENPAKIVSQATQQLTAEEKVMLKSEDNMKRTIRQQRCISHPPTPSSLRDLHIVGPWTMTGGIAPEKFLIHDNGPDSDSRLLVFATSPCLRLLSESAIWFMDGNFDQAPKGFLQLYVILVPLGEGTVSVAYAFMTRKTQEAYEELLAAIMAECASLGLYPAPDVVITDFERGAMNAVKSVLGEDTQTKACFFHLCQSTWRKVQELGLVSSYREDESFRTFVGMLNALAFLPADEVEDGMQLLRAFMPSVAGALTEYFDSTYVSGSFRRLTRPNGGLHLRRLPPRFPCEEWNVHEATVEDSHRTNNNCEAWNRRFSSLVGHSHPSVWKAIEVLRCEVSSVSVKIAQEAVGAPPKKRTASSQVQMQRRLQALCAGYTQGSKTMEQFLRGVSHTIRF